MYDLEFWVAFGESPLPLIATQEVIAFDGYGLQNENIITTKIDHDDLTKVALSTFDLPRADGGGVLSRFYRGREIKLEVTVKSDTAENFQILVDTFKKNLSKTEGNLDITINGEIRRIKATATIVDFSRQNYNVTYANASVVFTTVEPYFYAASPQSWFFPGYAASFDEEITNQGSTSSNPTFYFIFGAGTAVTEIVITAFNRVLTITENFAPWDLLIIDSINKTITKNGTIIDFTGMFPSFPAGSCPFSVDFTGTVLIDFTLLVPKNYI